MNKSFTLPVSTKQTKAAIIFPKGALPIPLPSIKTMFYGFNLRR